MTKTSTLKEKYLWKRSESRMIWFRLAVPKRFRAVAGRSLILESLGTTDPRRASILAAGRRSHLFAEWEAAARAGGPPILHTPSDEELEEAAVLLGSDLFIEEADESRRLIGPHLLSYVANQVDTELDEQTRFVATGDHGLERASLDFLYVCAVALSSRSK